MATAGAVKSGFVIALGEVGTRAVILFGDFCLFASRTFGSCVAAVSASNTFCMIGCGVAFGAITPAQPL